MKPVNMNTATRSAVISIKLQVYTKILFFEFIKSMLQSTSFKRMNDYMKLAAMITSHEV